MFSRGGIQGGEGVTGGEAWYVENVMEELVREIAMESCTMPYQHCQNALCCIATDFETHAWIVIDYV